jgi:ribosomal protein S27AE
MPDFFEGKMALMATMHQKEKWIGPVLEKGLGLTIKPIPSFDSDALGTFAGDVERPGNQWETALFKLDGARELMPDSDLFIVSEGAFFPHPEMPFVTRNLELLVLKDFRENVTVRARNIENGFPLWESEIRQWADILPKLENRNFDEEGLILKAKSGDIWLVYKDFDRVEDVRKAYEEFKKTGLPVALLGPDLRAHRNLRRRQNLVLAAKDLVRNANRFCSGCGSPGFSSDHFQPGLPCGWCGLPTRLPKAEIFKCLRCQWEQEQALPEKEADPAFCDFCNP